MRDMEKKRAYMKAYYAKHKEHLLARQMERDAARLEEKRTYNRERSARLVDHYREAKQARYQERKGELQEWQRAHYRANKAGYIRRAYARKERVRVGEHLTTPAQQVEIDGMYLFTSCFPWFEVDHIIPLRARNHSGLHVLGNLQVLTKEENRAKRNRVCPAYITIKEASNGHETR